MMQLDFWNDDRKLKTAITTISKARLKRYLHCEKDRERAALRLYFWNIRLSQSLYLPLQCWEIALRNKVHHYLCTKYDEAWPYHPKFRRILKKSEERKLSEAIERQIKKRGPQPHSDHLVADLSLGFWIALLGKNYNQAFGWTRTMKRKIFCHGSSSEIDVLRQQCRELLDLRNRDAHHEPIFHMKLPLLRHDLGELMRGLCPVTYGYMQKACNFEDIWHDRPVS